MIARMENPMVKYHDLVTFSLKINTEINAAPKIETVLLKANTITAGARSTNDNCTP